MGVRNRAAHKPEAQAKDQTPRLRFRLVCCGIVHAGLVVSFSAEPQRTQRKRRVFSFFLRVLCGFAVRSLFSNSWLLSIDKLTFKKGNRRRLPRREKRGCKWGQRAGKLLWCRGGGWHIHA